MTKPIINQGSLVFEKKAFETKLNKNLSNLTPVMRQYQEIKDKHLDKIVLFRMGDFYEIFGEDAIKSAAILQIQLTSRSRDKTTGTAMCGVPAHSLDGHLYKLVQAGYKVVICDQVGQINEVKGLIDRKIVQIATPGTLYSEELLQADSVNYLAAIYINKDINKIGLAICDIAGGEVFSQVYQYPNQFQNLTDTLCRYQPAEVLLPQNNDQKVKNLILSIVQSVALQINNPKKLALEYCPNSFFDQKNSLNLIDTKYQSFKNFNFNSLEELMAFGAVLSYIEATHLDEGKIYLSNPQVIENNGRMNLDELTIRNLDIFNPASELDFYRIFNHCLTPIGSRLLKNTMRQPYLGSGYLNSNYDAITELLNNNSLKTKLKNNLKNFSDLERLAIRIGLPNMPKANLLKLSDSLANLTELIAIASELKSDYFSLLKKSLHPLDYEKSIISIAIENIDPSGTMLFKKGYSLELDGLISKDLSLKRKIFELEKKEKEASGVNNLRVNFNRVFGYFIEVSKGGSNKVPDYFIRKQTLTNAERYTTKELQAIENEILNLGLDIEQLNEKLISEIVLKLNPSIEKIKQVALIIAKIDLILNFATNAELYNLKKPVLLENQQSIEIKAGRHLLVEQLISGSFITNDTTLNSMEQVAIISGPNMGGKSTYMKQVALIVFLAQIGSFVPAQEAKLSIFNRIFTRVGAADNIMRGESTFMVEMKEAANIIKSSESSSLIIIDELGRGTSTYDGISLAWATIEKILEIGALTLFSTHYHELGELANQNSKIFNLHVGVDEINSELIFKHKLKKGAAVKSYGIQVASIAGIPADVIKRSWEIYKKLTINENQKIDTGLNTETVEIIENNATAEEKNAVKEIKSLNLDNLSPLECLLILQKLKKSLS